MEMHELASQALTQFETKRRDNGEYFVSLKIDHEAWLESIVYDAHDDVMPNDWVYDVVREAIESIANENGFEDPNEFADGADVYNGDLLDWVKDYGPASGYIDEAIEEFGPARDFFHSIQMGQYNARLNIFNIVSEGLAERLGELDEYL